MTFLELVQMLARESGTVPGTQPPTLAGEMPARLDKMKNWVNLAWQMIQNHRASWKWMRAEFVAETAPGVGRYSGIALGLLRLRRFARTYGSFRLYDPDIGLGDERFLTPVDFWRYKRLYTTGVQEVSRPSVFAVADAAEDLCLGPLPDKYYILKGEYFKTPQALVDDDDIPEMPEHFHPMIVWQALVLLAGYDEGAFAVGNALGHFRQYLGNLERDQLPMVDMERRLF